MPKVATKKATTKTTKPAPAAKSAPKAAPAVQPNHQIRLNDFDTIARNVKRRALQAVEKIEALQKRLAITPMTQLRGRLDWDVKPLMFESAALTHCATFVEIIETNGKTEVKEIDSSKFDDEHKQKFVLEVYRDLLNRVVVHGSKGLTASEILAEQEDKAAREMLQIMTLHGRL